MDAVTLESKMSSPVTISPSNFVNLPRTLLTIMCRTENPTSEWTGSIAHLPATYPGMRVVVALLMAPSWLLICQPHLTRVMRQLFPRSRFILFYP